MVHYVIKIVLTTFLVVAVSEIAKRSTFLGAVLASVPIVSVLALVWLYIETKDVGKAASLSYGILWMVIPSLVLFVLMTVLLRREINFYISLGISVSATVSCYFLMLSLLTRCGIKL